MTQQDYNRLEQFLTEQMTPEESNSFMDDLRNNKDLREEAKMMALMIKEMKKEQAKRDSEIIEEVLASKKRAKVVKMIRWTLSIAAMFILIFSATTMWNKQRDKDALFAQTDALFTQYYSPFEATSSKGGDNEAIIKELTILYNKVGTDKDISSVIIRLQTIYDNILLKDEAYLDYKRYKNDIAWYLALAYLKVHNLDKGKELLKPLANNGDEDAIKLLNAIVSLEE